MGQAHWNATQPTDQCQVLDVLIKQSHTLGDRVSQQSRGHLHRTGVVIETEYVLAREHHLGTATQQSMQLFRCVLAMHLYRHVNGLVVVVFLFAF